MVFEFINLLLHPFLARITHHSLLFMLLAMVIPAATLVPVHHQLEKKTTQWLIEKISDYVYKKLKELYPN